MRKDVRVHGREIDMIYIDGREFEQTVLEAIESEGARRLVARQVASTVECIATFAAEYAVDIKQQATFLTLAEAATKWPEDALRVQSPQGPMECED